MELKNIPRIIYPYHVIPYDEKEIIGRIERKGYILKGKGDPVLTNCFVMKAAMIRDFYRYGGIPYALQYAELIRQKHGTDAHRKTRKEWLRMVLRIGRQILSNSFCENEVSLFFERIGVPRDVILEKIQEQVDTDPNRNTILKNIVCIKNRQLK